MPYYEPLFLSFAIAADAPVGVVIANYSYRLSRMYLWDTDADTFEAGQMLKGESTVLSISPDGSYVAYRAEAWWREPTHYMCISRPPYFTALAYIPAKSLSATDIEFRGGEVRVVDMPERVVTGCPFEFVQVGRTIRNGYEACKDARHSRTIYNLGSRLVTDLGDSSSATIIGFGSQVFGEVETPDWARVW